MDNLDTSQFKYLIDEFADLKVMRFRVPGWDNLSFSQKEYTYHLSEAAKAGRDILWDQNFKYNLTIRHALEAVIQSYSGDREDAHFKEFLVYAKRVFFSSGIHHHYAEDKFFPECPMGYFHMLLEESGVSDNIDAIIAIIYSKEKFLQRRCTRSDVDVVKESSVNFYEDVDRKEVEQYYESIEDKNSVTPVSYGLNSKVVKGEDGEVKEILWCREGMYSDVIEEICHHLSKASLVCENEHQRRALGLLIEYYTTGDLAVWDEFNIEWLKDTDGIVDFINGFIEDYNDPLGRKGAWEGYVHIKDVEASKRTEKMSSSAQWFEDNSPVDPKFKKKTVKGVSAKVVNAVCISGDSYPTTPIGINLPNADWIRKEHGSKSVTISNITRAYDAAAQESPRSVLSEFAYSDEEIALYKKYGSLTDEVHTDLHECLGHGSGQLLEGVSSTAMGEFASTLEEARADLFGLYYIADPKMVELGILPDMEAYKAQYSGYIRNGLMVQFNRVELGKQNTEAHMQNRQLIASWCYEMGKDDNVIEKKTRDGKTYFVVNDFDALRGLFARLLAEVQRIKSEGDYASGKALVEKYAVNIDPDIHREVRERYASLGLKPYGGFINPTIVPVEIGGKVTDYEIVYGDDYLAQQMEYASKYSIL
ncbi:MAG: dipeptidyl peptidase 3 [Bacteroidales bacterium]|nr:dipeptidyl peptidase 3 [Bacteroidales bacterium]